MKETAIQQLANSWHTTPNGIMFSICLIAVVVIAAVGIACVHLSVTDEEETVVRPGERQRRRL